MSISLATKQTSIHAYLWNMSGHWILLHPGSFALGELREQFVNKAGVTLRFLIWLENKMYSSFYIILFIILKTLIDIKCTIIINNSQLLRNYQILE